MPTTVTPDVQDIIEREEPIWQDHLGLGVGRLPDHRAASPTRRSSLKLGMAAVVGLSLVASVNVAIAADLGAPGVGRNLDGLAIAPASQLFVMGRDSDGFILAAEAPADTIVESPAPPSAPSVQPTMAAPPPVAPAVAPPAPTAAVVAAETAAQSPASPLPSASVSGLSLQLLNLHDAQRVASGLAPFALDATLVQIATQRAQDMALRNYFAHTSPSGETAFSIMNQVGFGYVIAGENIARNNYPDADSAQVAMTGLLNSPTHRANILDARFTKLGIATVVGADGMKYYAFIFAGQ